MGGRRLLLELVLEKEPGTCLKKAVYCQTKRIESSKNNLSILLTKDENNK